MNKPKTIAIRTTGLLAAVAVLSLLDAGVARAQMSGPLTGTASPGGSPELAPSDVPPGIDPAIWRAITTGRGSAYGVDAGTWQAMVGQSGGG